jgi:hypothetical protein
LLGEPAPRAEADALAAWATNGLKLGSALKDEWATEIVLARLTDESAVEATIEKPLRRINPTS